MDLELHECALNGDVDFLKELMSRDEHILERSEAANSKGNNILHIAAIYGHVHFAREVLNAKPELSSELNEAGLSPLHLAAAKGHLGLLKLLLAVDPDLSSLKDRHGRLPVHTAAMKGKVNVLKEIISVNPWSLKERTEKGETVLHLSVKENRIQVVEFLMGIEEVRSIVNEGDCGSNTALHLAAARNLKEIIRILMDSGTVNVNALNKYNITAHDLIRLREPNEDDEIVILLNPNNAPATTIEHAVLPSTIDHPTETALGHAKKAHFKQAGNVMIVDILIATVTFQGALTPPGGFWQDNSADPTMKAVAASSPSSRLSLNQTNDPLVNISAPNSPRCHQTAGTAVLCATAYDNFMQYDIYAFVSSLFVILLLLLMKSAVLPKPLVLCALLFNICIAIMFMAVAFYYAIDATKPVGSIANWAYVVQIVDLSVTFFVGISVTSLCTRVVKYMRRMRGRTA